MYSVVPWLLCTYLRTSLGTMLGSYRMPFIVENYDDKGSKRQLRLMKNVLCWNESGIDGNSAVRKIK